MVHGYPKLNDLLSMDDNWADITSKPKVRPISEDRYVNISYH